MLSEDPALLTAFFDESMESLAGLEARVIELPKAEDGLRAEVDAIFRPGHTLKGNAPFFGFLRLQELAHALETVLDRQRTGRIGLDPVLVIGDLLDHLQQRVSTRIDDHGLVQDMRQAVASFAALSSELQRSIMAVRRVQVRPLLQKASRLARDIAQATGKDIEVVLQGEATELDKGRLEMIDGPLTHLVRNCADHGIEPPDRRTAAGKPARGVITVAASAAEGWFQLDIADDGKGLDLEAIRRKGEAMGLVRPGAALDQQAIVNLIFASGLSTAQRVSDVSGRGVGMDVVHRQIHEAGGTVEVTTAYDGGGDGHGLVIRHGRTMPVVPLGRLLGQADANDGRPPGRQTVVTIERADRILAIAVDETLGVRRLVVRPLYGLTDGDLGGGFQGAALLGDGRLALIIAPNALCNPEAHHA